MKHIGRNVDIDPYDQHYWIQRFFKHLKDNRMLVNGRELGVAKLVRQLEKFCLGCKIDRQHLMHVMLNDHYIVATAEHTYDISWDKVR